MNRFEYCPLSKTCRRTKDRFYRHKKGLKSCENYFDCKVLSAAWKLPIERRYDKNGGYWFVDVTPIVSEWNSGATYQLSHNHPYCPVWFFGDSRSLLGYWFDRDLPLPTFEKLSERGYLETDEIVAMEIKQTYQIMGFFKAVPINL